MQFSVRSRTILILSLIIFTGCSEDETPATDDEFSAQISVSTSAATVSEDIGTIMFDLTLNQDNTSGGALTFTYTLSGTSTSGSDYQSPSGSVTIADGERRSSVTVTIIDDEEAEEAETLIFTLNENTLPENISLATNSATVTISDNDEAAPDPGNNSELGGEDVTLTFSSSDGNSITVGDWTEVTNALGYLILINDEDNFQDIASGSTIASSTYAGTGEQVVYAGASPDAFSVSLLQEATTYFFKVVAYNDETFDNDQSADQASTTACSASSTTESEVCFEIDEANGLRKFTSNQFPNHATGRFPNASVTATSLSQEVPLNPANTNSATYVFDESSGPTPRNQNFYRFGVASNGMGYNPMGLKPWTNPDTGEENWEWQAAVINEGDTDLDEYGAHVTSQGVYHYHGDITGLASSENGSRHSSIYGWAADGFPIYYKYGFEDANDTGSNVVELTSSYRLKSGERGGDGLNAPDGNHDGTYIQDYEYVQGMGDLDECNGRTGVTPEFPGGTYYYVITSDFPKVPNCFMGTPDEGFIIGN